MMGMISTSPGDEKDSRAMKAAEWSSENCSHDCLYEYAPK